MKRAVVPLLLSILLLPPAAGRAEAPPQEVPVAALASLPTVDGELQEWGDGGWVHVPIKPAVEKGERSKLGLDGPDRNNTGSITVQLKAGVAGGRFYLAARWPDKTADTEYRPWRWDDDAYKQDKRQLDDMFAVRFNLGADKDFDRSMLAMKEYRVDVWLWSAGRTNPAGLAEDMVHRISPQEIDDAQAYDIPGKGTVYIKKDRDAGGAIYRALPAPKKREGDVQPQFTLTGNASGSATDVMAKGTWKGGYWNLEFSRKLATGHPDDAAFKPGQKLLGQIAVFNRAELEHKSVSEPLLFDFSRIK